jgi:hypothetical protein
VDREIEDLFHELADLTPEERQKRFSERGVSPTVRAEVEALFQFDSQTARAINAFVADCAELALKDVDEEKVHAVSGVAHRGNGLRRLCFRRTADAISSCGTRAG